MATEFARQLHEQAGLAVPRELRPLPLEECEYLATLWIQGNPVRFSDGRTKRRFVRPVAQDSGGVCKSSSCDWYADHAVAVKGQ